MRLCIGPICCQILRVISNEIGLIENSIVHYKERELDHSLNGSLSLGYWCGTGRLKE